LAPLYLPQLAIQHYAGLPLGEPFLLSCVATCGRGQLLG